MACRLLRVFVHVRAPRGWKLTLRAALAQSVLDVTKDTPQEEEIMKASQVASQEFMKRSVEKQLVHVSFFQLQEDTMVVVHAARHRSL